MDARRSRAPPGSRRAVPAGRPRARPRRARALSTRRAPHARSPRIRRDARRIVSAPEVAARPRHTRLLEAQARASAGQSWALVLHLIFEEYGERSAATVQARQDRTPW